MYRVTFKKSCLAAAMLTTLAGVANAQFGPVKLDVSSYNQDMIVEKPVPATTATIDNGSGNTGATFYEIGFNVNAVTTGIPNAGSSFSNPAADHTWTMAPDFTTNDAISIDGIVTNATVTITSPAAYSTLSFLVASGNGAETNTYKLHFQDNSIQTGTFVLPDWFNNTVNLAYTANGRCDVNSRNPDSVNSGNPRMYYADITVSNAASPITSIDFIRVGGGRGAIFAISGNAGAGFNPIAFTGYNRDMILEAAAQHNPPGTAYTTASMDASTTNNGTTWYQKGYDSGATNTGVPAPGTTIASAAASDHQYTFAPSYTSNNVIMVDPTFTAATLTWAIPTNHSALSFLTTAGHGPATIDYTINFSDFTTESGSFQVLDWFGGSNNVALNANGRVDLASGLFQNVNGGNPRIYTKDITVTNSGKTINSVNVYWDPGNTNTGLVAFFGVSGTGGTFPPLVGSSPASFNTNLGTTALFSATVSGTPPLTLLWQKGTNNVFANLANGGTITGANTTNLSISNVAFLDDGDYRLIVSNSLGSATSSVATLNVVSATPDVTVPSDPVSIYNGSSPAAEVVAFALDNTTSKYLNFGFSGFPPFVGPVGFVVTPAMGSSVVTGIRMYTANDSPERDPADYLLEGSNDSGTTFTPIASGTVKMPDDRNAAGLTVNPVTLFNREVHFANNSAYKTYRWSVANVKNNASANSMQVGEVELLGTAPPVNVTIAIVPQGGGVYQLQWSNGTLQSSTNVATGYTNVIGAAAPTYNVTNSATPQLFFRVQVQ